MADLEARLAQLEDRLGYFERVAVVAGDEGDDAVLVDDER